MQIEYRSFTIPDEVTDELRGWFEAVALGFGEGCAQEESLQRWREEVARDGWRLDGAYASTPGFGLGDHVPVGTFATTTQTVNVGNGRLEPVCFITDVTVRTTHRRRGLLTRLMTDALRRARDEGLSMAALTVTEGGIYGRFGFGVATSATSGELDSGPRFQLTRDIEPRVELATPEQSVAARRVVFEALHATTRGSHQRLAYYDSRLSGLWDLDKNGPNLAVRSAVHLDADGQPDGVVSYQFDDEGRQLRVRDLLAADPQAELGLWQFLAAIDLVEKVVVSTMSPTTALPWALADPRRLKVTGTTDFTWLRVLDVVRALEVRGFESDGEVAFTVDDALGLASGSYKLVVRDRKPVVTPVSGAHVRLDVRALGSLYFGLVDAHVLAAAGQVTGPEAGVVALSSLFRTALPPVNTSGF